MPVSPIAPVQGVLPTDYLSGAASVPATDGSGFASSLTGAVDNLQQLQSTSKQLAVSAVTGNLDDIHNATIAASYVARAKHAVCHHQHVALGRALADEERVL